MLLDICPASVPLLPLLQNSNFFVLQLFILTNASMCFREAISPQLWVGLIGLKVSCSLSQGWAQGLGWEEICWRVFLGDNSLSQGKARTFDLLVLLDLVMWGWDSGSTEPCCCLSEDEADIEGTRAPWEGLGPWSCHQDAEPPFWSCSFLSAFIHSS